MNKKAEFCKIGATLVLLFALSLGAWRAPGASAAAKPEDSACAELAQMNGRDIATSSYPRNWAMPDSVYYYLDAQHNLCMVSVDAASCSFNVYTYTQEFGYIGCKTVSFAGYARLGGFYKAPDGSFYVAVGQPNHGEDDDLTVIEIRKYKQDWTLAGAATIPGGISWCFKGIYEPFFGGTCHMAMYNGQLVVHTARIMYAASNGLRHQSNICFVVNCQTMAARVFPDSSLYCSHSFNQFVRADGNRLVFVDHGDAYPRQVCMGIYENGSLSRIPLINLMGSTGDNYTGTTVTGLEVSASKYLVTGNSVPHYNPVNGVSGFDSSMIRNIYLVTADKTSRASSFQWITSYPPRQAGIKVMEPRLVRLSADRFVLLFSVEQNGATKMEYRLLNANGEVVAQKSFANALFVPGSDPLAAGERILWIAKASTGEIVAFQMNISDPTDPQMVVPVRGVKMEKSAITININESVTIGASVIPLGAGNAQLLWSSSDLAVADAKNGVVTARGFGKAVITAKSAENPAMSATCTVTVKPIVRSIVLNKDVHVLSLKRGQSLRMPIAIEPAGARSAKIIWESESRRILTVDKNGKLKGVRKGKAWVYAYSADDDAVGDSCLVFVDTAVYPVAGIWLSKAEAMTLEGELTLNATVLPGNASLKALNWWSDDPDMLDMYDDGTSCELRAWRSGTTVIHCQSQSNPAVQATCQITVLTNDSYVAVQSVSLSQQAMTLEPGETRALSAIVSPADASLKDVFWVSSNDYVAGVSDAGLVVAAHPGAATISAVSVDGKRRASCAVVVSGPAQKLATFQQIVYLKKGQSAKLPYLAVRSDGAPLAVSWSSSNAKAVSVDKKGKLTGRKKGAATITLSTAEGLRSQLSVLCGSGKPASGITITSMPLGNAMTVGGMFEMRVTVSPTNAQGVVSFRSSDVGVLKVSALGLLEAIRPGKATITVTIGSKNKSLTITVL